MLKKVVLIIISGILVSALVGCNTVAGFGRDIKESGEALEKEAQKSK
jgi:predicted small secreted protein